MKKSRRFSSQAPEIGERNSNQRARKNGHSVLIQRAVLFTAAVFLVAVLVGSPVYHLVDRYSSLHMAQAQAEPMLDLLYEKVSFPYDDDAGRQQFNNLADMLGTADIAVWHCNVLGNTIRWNGENGDDQMNSDEVNQRLMVVHESEEPRRELFSLKFKGKNYLMGIHGSSLAVAIALPLDNYGSGFASLAGLLAGFVAACIAAWPLSKRLLLKSVQQISELTDIASRVAGGDFDAHADENAPDEMGQLGKALNRLSHELSRNMYMLIVERNRLKHMLDGLSEGIIAIDVQGQITHINPAIAQMFEQKKISVGLPDPRMKHVPDQTVWQDFDSVIKSGEICTRNFTVRDMIIRLTITPIVDEIGSIAGAVGLFSDITKSERLERTRREYVSNVSHELRTPLTAVRALVEPLKEGMVTKEEDRMRYYDIILREVMRLSRLINDQLELSRLQSGGVAIQKQRMTLDDLIYDVCDRYNSIAEEKGLKLNIESELDGIPSVWGNPDRVEQMFIILLDNAIKYTEEGSVNVRADWDEEKVSITVRDTGIGIAEEDLPYVFDRFYKVDKAHSGKGSGLGLSIAKELLKRMDEDIHVESVQGEGTAFTFTVHRNPPAEEEA